MRYTERRTGQKKENEVKYLYYFKKSFIIYMNQTNKDGNLNSQGDKTDENSTTKATNSTRHENKQKNRSV
jgi:hypothetical protein